jgi:hypothetical protein
MMAAPWHLGGAGTESLPPANLCNVMGDLGRDCNAPCVNSHPFYEFRRWGKDVSACRMRWCELNGANAGEYN